MAEGRVGEFLCSAAELVERGRARVFEVLWHGERVQAFALRFGGRVVAYVNRCVHRPNELDWLPGEFLDDERRWIICAVHGALYEPADGRCAGGPCGRGRLTAVEVEQRGDDVYWYPSATIGPLRADVAASRSPE